MLDVISFCLPESLQTLYETSRQQQPCFLVSDKRRQDFIMGTMGEVG